MVTMGARQSLGLFISPLQSSTGLHYHHQPAFAIAQLMLASSSRSLAVADPMVRENPYRSLVVLPSAWH